MDINQQNTCNIYNTKKIQHTVKQIRSYKTHDNSSLWVGLVLGVRISQFHYKQELIGQSAQKKQK